MYQYYFEKLDVWKLSIDLSLKIYKLTEAFPSDERFGLTSQLRRAITSVPTNLTEGLSRDSFKDQARFTTIAYGSLMEVLNLLIISYKLNYFEEKTYLELRTIINEVSNKINALKKSQLKRI
ncbi:MAG: four helix bundle protein [Flavobacteriaceae bacterium]